MILPFLLFRRDSPRRNVRQNNEQFFCSGILFLLCIYLIIGITRCQEYRFLLLILPAQRAQHLGNTAVSVPQTSLALRLGGASSLSRSQAPGDGNQGPWELLLLWWKEDRGFRRGSARARRWHTQNPNPALRLALIPTLSSVPGRGGVGLSQHMPTWRAVT